MGTLEEDSAVIPGVTWFVTQSGSGSGGNLTCLSLVGGVGLWLGSLACFRSRPN